MDATAHRPHRYGNGPCDLLVRETDDVTENDRLPELEGKLEQRFLHVITKGDPGIFDIGRRRVGTVPPVDLIGERCRRPSVPAPDVVEEGVTGDPPEPSLEAARLIRRQALADTEQDFLDEISGVVTIAGEAIGEVVDLPSIYTRNLFPGEWDGLRHWRPTPTTPMIGVGFLGIRVLRVFGRGVGILLGALFDSLAELLGRSAQGSG
jgi:hypothetical protein